jgi:hypothetical protein
MEEVVIESIVHDMVNSDQQIMDFVLVGQHNLGCQDEDGDNSHPEGLDPCAVAKEVEGHQH